MTLWICHRCKESTRVDLLPQHIRSNLSFSTKVEMEWRSQLLKRLEACQIQTKMVEYQGRAIRVLQTLTNQVEWREEIPTIPEEVNQTQSILHHLMQIEETPTTIESKWEEPSNLIRLWDSMIMAQKEEEASSLFWMTWFQVALQIWLQQLLGNQLQARRIKQQLISSCKVIRMSSSLLRQHTLHLEIYLRNKI